MIDTDHFVWDLDSLRNTTEINTNPQLQDAIDRFPCHVQDWLDSAAFNALDTYAKKVFDKYNPKTEEDAVNQVHIEHIFEFVTDNNMDQDDIERFEDCIKLAYAKWRVRT